MWVETRFSQMRVGSRYCHVHSPGEHGFDLWWVSWHSELHWFKYKSKMVLQIQTKKKKASETRGEVISHPYRRFQVVVFFKPPPVMCPLTLGEMQQSALWGEAASSLVLHPGGSCGCVWGLITVSFLLFFTNSTQKEVGLVWKMQIKKESSDFKIKRVRTQGTPCFVWLTSFHLKIYIYSCHLGLQHIFIKVGTGATLGQVGR